MSENEKEELSTETNNTPINFKESNTTFDKIYAFYVLKNPPALSPKNTAIKERWVEIWTLQTRFKSPSQAIKAHLEAHPEINQAQAYRDRKNADRLFGNLFQVEKEGRKALLYEYNFSSYQMAIRQKDLKAQATFLKQMAELSDFDKDNDLLHNPEKLEDREDKYFMDPSMNEAVMKFLLKNGSVDFNNLQAEDAEIIED